MLAPLLQALVNRMQAGVMGVFASVGALDVRGLGVFGCQAWFGFGLLSSESFFL